ncbi:MAG: phosphoribosylglycinamide formyltransferase [Granulosicoccaceae bacterium]
MNTIAVLISGRGSNFKALFDACNDGRIDATICAVVSDNPDALGLQFANEHGIATHAVEKFPSQSRQEYDRALISTLDYINADWLALAGFMRILGPEIVNRYIGKLINIHPSLLPAYIGINTHQRVIDAAERKHGATVHFVTEELDGGPIIKQQSIDVLPTDTAETLAKRVLQIEHTLYPLVMQFLISGHARYENGKCYLDD